MDKIQILEVETLSGIEEHIIIDHGNEQFTSMPKSVYDAQVEHLTEIPPQAALSTPIVSDAD